MSEERVCERCLGTGWILEDAGGSKVAKRCSCYGEHRRRTLLEQANIPRRYAECRLDNFEGHNDTQKDALRYCRDEFVKNFLAQKAGILFIGPCGVGKTHLAVAVLQELIQKKNIAGLFYDFRDLIREIQSTFTPDSNLSESDVLAPVFQADLLVLDELGAKRTSAWVEETVFYIINYRYNQKKMTIFTTNYLDIDEHEDTRDSFYKKGEDSLVSRIGVRLRSRLYEMCKIVEIDGEDHRKMARQASYQR